MEECSSDFVDKLYIEYSSGVAKITINNRVSVTKSEWSVLASVILVIALLWKRVQKSRLYKEKGKWKCYIYVTTRKQNATITVELEFSWFFSSFFIETRAFKIYHNNENWTVSPYSTTKMLISILFVKK